MDATDRSCDRSERMVSPLYVAIHSDQTRCIQMFLEEGFSPDAQDCTRTLGFSSPLALALFRANNKPGRWVALTPIPSPDDLQRPLKSPWKP